MANEYPYPRPHRLDLDDIKISITHESYDTALQTVYYYHRQAITMTPDEQGKYVEMVRKNGRIVILSPTGVPLLESAESPLRTKPTRPDTSGLNAVVGDVLGCDIFATQFYARCCHMWDLKKFLPDAPKPEGSDLNLYQQIAGCMKNGEFCVDVTFAGYDMHLEGLVFLRKAKEYGQHKILKDSDTTWVPASGWEQPDDPGDTPNKRKDKKDDNRRPEKLKVTTSRFRLLDDDYGEDPSPTWFVGTPLPNNPTGTGESRTNKMENKIVALELELQTEREPRQAQQKTITSQGKPIAQLEDPENVYSHAHFVMLAVAYGISKLSHLRENVEGAGDVFEIIDYSEHYDHFYHHSTPSPTEDGPASAVATPAHGSTLVDETPSTGATPINRPMTPPPIELQFAPAAPPLRARQAWDPFLSSPATAAVRSPLGEAPVQPNSAPVQPTVGLRATTPISIPSTTPEPQPTSPTYSPQLNTTPNANEGRYSPSIEIFVSLDQDYLDADAEEITEVEESEEDMEYPEVKPVFTYTQLATIFKLNKVKKEKEPNHVTMTLEK
ncbi:hypothetical protein V8C40DRAFT_263660 [Trichoderma camerunense]